jgi:hypothetical protein
VLLFNEVVCEHQAARVEPTNTRPDQTISLLLT